MTRSTGRISKRESYSGGSHLGQSDPSPVRVFGGEDGWLRAAAAIRHAAFDGPGIDTLSSSARFQTHGRGPTVCGVALTTCREGAVQADVGLVLTAEAVRDCLQSTLRATEQRMRAAWAHFPEAPPLGVCLHIVDMVIGDTAL